MKIKKKHLGLIYIALKYFRDTDANNAEDSKGLIKHLNKIIKLIENKL